MNVKRKYYAFLFIALVIGIAIGALLNRAIMQRQVKRIMEIRAAGLLVDDVQRFLKPITTEQQLLIQKIIEKHAQALSQIHERFSTEIEAAFKSLKAELDPVLTPEQKKEFEKMIPGRPPVFPRGRRGFPPRREPPPVEFELEDEALDTGIEVMESFANNRRRSQKGIGLLAQYGQQLVQ